MILSMGPILRVGVLQNKDTMEFEFLGSYFLPGSEAACAPGEWKASAAESVPAELRYTLIYKKCFTIGEAEAYIKDHPSVCRRWITVGENICIRDRELQGEEYWVAGKSFPAQREAEEYKGTLSGAEYIDILPEVIKPAEGVIVLTAPGGSEHRLTGKVLFQGTEDKRNRVVLHDVLVGIDFHWEHLENQRYRGDLEIKIDNRGMLTAVNILPLEEYLFSVNSSEMKSDCPVELLKAQTVAARNTVLATRRKHHYADGFDICADDHCQCYRGSTREREASLDAVMQTCGEILLYENIICDTRYSKICGGISEDFNSAWFSDPVPYMKATLDLSENSKERAASFFPANSEQSARELIQSNESFFCNVNVQEIPSTIEYAREYFRWTFRYEAEELGKLVEKKTGHEVGRIQDLIPVKRGKSGRIEWLKIAGEKKTVTIGKELQIRFALHEKCLYSGCFFVEKEEEAGRHFFILHGAGWGHGVGMCQIGATVMAHQGYSHKEILNHYFPGTALLALYERFSEENLQEYHQKQERRGERCYEFFNCYEVHQCPVYHNTAGERCWIFAAENTREIFPCPIREKINCPDCEFKSMHEKEEENV